MSTTYGEEHARADPLRLPDPALRFEERAARLAKLAAGNSAGDFLALLARVARGQAAAVRLLSAGGAGAAAPVEDAAPRAARPPLGPGQPAPAAPPLAAEAVPRDETWRRMLAVVLDAVRGPGLPAETDEALRRLAGAGAAELEEVATAVLAGEVPRERLALAPFVGAALQAWFSALAARLDPAAVASGTAAATCPVCGSPPVAALVQGKDRLRYLVCALCSAEWNYARVRCAVCGKDDELAYYGIEAEPGAKAEACGRCRVYVKLFDEEHRAGAEPAADDAATLALDLMLAEEGWRRLGMNLYLAAAG